MRSGFPCDAALGLYLWLVVVTGVRRGELCGLQIRDIDLDRGLVHVAFNYVVRGGQRVREDTKTHQDRWLATDPDTCALIATYLDEISTELADVGARLRDDAYLFSNDPGALPAVEPGLGYPPDRGRRRCCRGGAGQAERPADRRRRIPGCLGGQERPVTIPVGDGVVQARLAGRAPRADLQRGFGRLAAAGEEQIEVSAAARRQFTPARGKTRWRGEVAVTRRTGRHRAGSVTRARHAAAKAARSATSGPLAANSSANRCGYRRVVLRRRGTPRCAAAPPAIASRRTVSREAPDRGSLANSQLAGIWRAEEPRLHEASRIRPDVAAAPAVPPPAAPG
jgi:hypothetical protein